MKTRQRKEDAAVDDDDFGDNISSARINYDPMSWTSFDDTAKSSAFTKCSNDARVNEGAEAPKSRLSPVEMRTPTHADVLLHPGSASTTLRAIFHPQSRP